MSIEDQAENYQRDPNSTALDYENVTASDVTPLPRLARNVRVGTAGNLTVINAEDREVLFANMQAGEHTLGFVKQIKATGTTASDFVAYYK